MPNDFDRIEDERDLTAGLEYDERTSELDVAGAERGWNGADAYDLDDPKHERHYETFADYADARDC